MTGRLFSPSAGKLLLAVELSAAVLISTPPTFAELPAFEDPRYDFEVTTGGETIRATEDQITSASINGKSYTVQIKRTGLRRLSLDGLSLDYPANFSFGYANDDDFEPPGETWFVNGDKTELWISRVIDAHERTTKIALRETMKDYDDQKIEWSSAPRDITLAGKRFKGALIVAEKGLYSNRPVSLIFIEVPMPRFSYVICVSGEMKSRKQYGEAFLSLVELIGSTMTIGAVK
ncbi:MAG: hypothetical protein AAGI08_15290 [Bacteroidota bacterium]